MDEALREAAQAAGGYHALGRRLGISGQAIWQWQRCPAERVLEIEALTGVSRYRLRPDLYQEVKEENLARFKAVLALIDRAVGELDSIWEEYLNEDTLIDAEGHPGDEKVVPPWVVDIWELGKRVAKIWQFKESETSEALGRMAVRRWLETPGTMEKFQKRESTRDFQEKGATLKRAAERELVTSKRRRRKQRL